MQQDERPYQAAGDDDKLAWLRILLAPDVSLASAYYQIHRRHFEGRAAAATVEAVMYELRTYGLAQLKKPNCQRRLGELSPDQLHEVCARLQKLKPEIAKPWPADDMRLLLEAWAICHGR